VELVDTLIFNALWNDGFDEIEDCLQAEGARAVDADYCYPQYWGLCLLKDTGHSAGGFVEKNERLGFQVLLVCRVLGKRVMAHVLFTSIVLPEFKTLDSINIPCSVKA